MLSVKSQRSSPTCGLGSLHSFALAQCSLNIDLNICTNTGLLLSNCYLHLMVIPAVLPMRGEGGQEVFKGRKERSVSWVLCNQYSSRDAP